MFQLTNQPINSEHLREQLSSDSAGALCVFEGLVRNHNDGHDVEALEYEAQEALCASEAKKIFEEAKAQFEIIEAKCVHRIGRLEIGEMAVWVGVLAAHRDEACKACRYIIDETKARLPIWKKEHYTSGESGWINCQSVVTNS